MEAHVNLWELITTVAISKHNLPNQDRCLEIKQACVGACSYGSEISLTIDKGVWTIRIFDHTNSCDRSAELRIDSAGGISVTRVRVENGIRDDRTVSF